MTAKRLGGLLIAACLFFSLPSCEKEEPPKVYKPYDFDLASYIRPGDILGVTYTPMDTSVTDEEVDCALCRALKAAGLYDTQLASYRLTDLTDGAVARGDTVELSASATVDGAPFADACADRITLTAGESGVRLDGFDDALIGMPVGQTTEVTLTFPSDYSDLSLRGREVVLAVTVACVKERLSLPEVLTPEQLAAASPDLPDAVALRDRLREELTAQKTAAAAEKKINDCWQAAVSQATVVSYPAVEIERYMKDYRAYILQQANEAGCETVAAYEQKLGLPAGELETRGMECARGDILQEMMVYSVARAEGFDKMSDELFSRYAMPIAQELGLSTVKELTDAVGYDDVQKRVLTRVVKEYIAENGVPLLPVDPTGDPDVTDAPEPTAAS